MKKIIALILAFQTYAYSQVVIQGPVTLGGPITVAIGTAPAPQFQITTLNQPSGVVGSSYTSATIQTVNGISPISFATTVQIPGETFSSSTGAYTGTPTQAGSYQPCITATDNSGPPGKTYTQCYSISIASQPIAGGGHNEKCNSLNQWIGPLSKPMPTGTPGGNTTSPLNCLNTAMANTPSPGGTVNVTAGSCTSLQNAISNAVAGETIVIPAQSSPGVQDVFLNCRITPTAVGNAANWITVETDQMANMPSEGQRITPAWAGITSMPGYPNYNQPTTPGIYVPKIITSNTGNWVMQFGAGASFWRFIGIEITSPAGATAAQLIEQTSATSGANHIIFDRTLCHGGNNPNGADKDQVQACWGEDGVQFGAVIDSYWYDTHTGGGKQSQAVTLGGNTTIQSGPYKVTNNFLSSAGEIIFSGGSGQGQPQIVLPSSDAEIRLNSLYKPMFWKTGDPSYFGVNFELDNLMEFKNSQRYWIEGNVLEHSVGAQGTQQGNGIIIGPRNQSIGFSGAASMDTSGNVTWTSGGVKFSLNQVSPYCAAANHCMFVINNLAYQVASFVSPTQITLQLCNNGCPNASGIKAGTSFAAVTNVSFGAALPGLNPNAVDNDIVLINNYLHGAARGIAVAIAVSNNGDLPKSLQRVYIANNAMDWGDGGFWNNNAPGAGSVWGMGTQIQSGPGGPLIDGLVFDHNSIVTYLTAVAPGEGPSFGFGVKSQTVNHLQVTNNIGASGYGLASNGSMEALFNSWVPQGERCFDHNIFAIATNPLGPNSKGTYVTQNNQPFPSAADNDNCPFTPSGNTAVADFNAVDFTSINTGTSTINFQLTASSPGHNGAPAGDLIGADIGVNYATLQAAIANVAGIDPTGTVLTTSDTLLKTGGAITGTCTVSCGSGVNSVITKGSNNLWLMFTDTFKITSGSGTVTQAYPGTGSMTTTVNLTGLNITPVNAYPFVLYGCDPFSNCYNGQPPQFPASLSGLANLYADINYTFGGTLTGSNIDLLFDEWVCNSNHPTNSNQCLEVEILPYYNFTQNACGSPIHTLTENVVVNGTPTTMQFDECVGGNVIFVPHSLPGSSAQELKLDLLPLLKQGLSDWGAVAPCTPNACSWISGIELGTEFGDAATQSYSLGFTKIEIDQVLP